MEAKVSSVILICANSEWEAVTDLFNDKHYHTSPYGDFFYQAGEAAGILERVIFFHTGWGKVAAAAGTQYAIDRWKPGLLVNIGTCGGFEGERFKGEIIMANKTVIYDIYEQMGDPVQHINHYTVEIDNSWLITPYPIDVILTTLISADRDLIPTDVADLKEKYGASAGDWESGAIAWVAKRNLTNCLILRGVTDIVGPGGGEAYDGNIDVYRENTRLIMKKLIQSLPAWLSKLSKANN